MICVLVWHNPKSGAAVIGSSALGITARARNAQHGQPLPVVPGRFAVMQREFALCRTVHQAAHVTKLVRSAEAALLGEFAVAPLRLVQNGKP
jgi:hypothetical protein